jgi:transposase
MEVFVMSKRKIISLEIKLRVVKKCMDGDSNPHHEAKQLGIHAQTVLDWSVRYKANGTNGLKRS